MNKFVKIVIIASVSSYVAAAAVQTESSWLTPEMGVIKRVFNDCDDKADFTGCLKGKALTAISRAIEQDSIQLSEGIVLVKENDTSAEDVTGFTDPRSLSGFSGIDRSLIQKFGKLINTHSIRFDMNAARGNKDKKGHRYVIAALLTAMGIAGPLGLKALATIAGKALVISKVALTIAGIIALKKIFSSDAHEETSFQVHAGDHNRRNAYVVRTAKPSSASVDPYRYYYDQHYGATA